MPELQVNSPSIAYSEMVFDWNLVNTLMGGTRAMRQAGEIYLPREPKESQKAYANRLKRSYLFNAYKDTIDKLLGKPFSKPITLKPETPEKIIEWSKDIDLCGSNITTFAKDIFKSGLNHGLAHILVDHPKNTTVRTLADEQTENIRPYFVLLDATDLIAWQSEMINGCEQLTQIRIRETSIEPDGLWGEKSVTRIRVITPESFQLYEQTDKDKWVVVETGDNTLGKIPLATFYTERTGFMSGKPPLLDSAYLNLQHWQSSSDQEHILHFIRFPLLHGSGFKKAQKEIEVGPNRMITSEDPQAKLEYVEHSGAAVEAGRQSIKDIEERMSVLGLQLLIKKPGTPTATASAIDSATSESPLQTMVRSLENTITQSFGFMKDWANLESKDIGGIDINQDFGVSLKNASDIDTLLKSRVAGEISRETFLSEMKRRGLLQDTLSVEEEIERIDSDSFQFNDEE